MQSMYAWWYVCRYKDHFQWCGNDIFTMAFWSLNRHFLGWVGVKFVLIAWWSFFFERIHQHTHRFWGSPLFACWRLFWGTELRNGRDLLLANCMHVKVVAAEYAPNTGVHCIPLVCLFNWLPFKSLDINYRNNTHVITDLIKRRAGRLSRVTCGVHFTSIMPVTCRWNDQVYETQWPIKLPSILLTRILIRFFQHENSPMACVSAYGRLGHLKIYFAKYYFGIRRMQSHLIFKSIIFSAVKIRKKYGIGLHFDLSQDWGNQEIY